MENVYKYYTMTRTEIQDKEREELAEFIEQHWHSRLVMSKGKSYYPHQEQGFLERRDGKIVGVLTYRIENNAIEILTLNSLLSGQGIGTSLILDTIEKARSLGATRIWLTTTNDHLRAIGFYQRLGFRMVAINVGAVDEARTIKPEIPLMGDRGVPIHDEIVMELTVEPYIDN